jgi:hypothetical protein
MKFTEMIQMSDWIKKIHQGDGNSPDRYDPEAFRTHQSAKLLLCSPRERIEILDQLDSAIGSEGGSSLRSKAGLMQLRSELARTHRQLLALKR